MTIEQTGQTPESDDPSLEQISDFEPKEVEICFTVEQKN
jgi:hypothetical protein